MEDYKNIVGEENNSEADNDNIENDNLTANENSFQPGDDVKPVEVVSSTKKDNIIKKIIALCVACAVFGGIFGGVVSGLIVKSIGKNSEDKTPDTVLSMNDDKNDNNENGGNDEKPVSAENTTAASTEKTTEIKSGTVSSAEEQPDLELTFDAKDIYKYNVESVVSIEVTNRTRKGYGTGFIISEEGYIVTNYHVVDGASSVLVTMYNDKSYAAEVIGYEETNDIAVIKIKPDGKIQSLIYGKSSDLEVGDSLYVIGNPLGDLTFTLTTGVVSALNRLIDTDTGMQINMFQTNAAINSGNSGGPVFDEHGFVVGIASAKYAAAAIEGLGFCIPIDDVRSMIDEIINKGYVSGKPSMGVSVHDREVATYGFLQSTRSISGAKVSAVGNNTAGAKAGLKVGDIIVKADGTQITSVSTLKTVMSNHRSGDTIDLTVYRNGSQVQMKLTFDEYSPSSPRTDSDYDYDL